MSYSNKITTLHEIAPKVFIRLERFLDQDMLATIMDDYRICAEHGGNLEPGMVREEGVSFNPRLARILLLLVADGRVHDSSVLRAALYAASLSDAALSTQLHNLCGALLGLVRDARSAAPQTAGGALIRGVIELDTVRHIHQTNFSSDERATMLKRAEAIHSCVVQAQAPEWVSTKLNHAIVLQRRDRI
jgi:hypothetical protein